MTMRSSISTGLSARLATRRRSYLTSGGWIQGLMRSSLKATEVNGLKAVTANARAGEFNFRVAVFEHNGRLFRLLFAVRSLTDETEKQFDASIASFRPLSAEEVGSSAKPEALDRRRRTGRFDRNDGATHGPRQSSGGIFSANQRPRQGSAAQPRRILQDCNRMNSAAAGGTKRVSAGLFVSEW